jgi:hypothetical protein
MNETTQNTTPGFLQGTEVARHRPVSQPGFDEQLPLLEKDLELKKKLYIALVVIFSVFIGGMILGAALGFFL